MSDIDFAELADDYRFFLAHSDESAAQIAALGPLVQAQLSGRNPAPVLDFGCGDGGFIDALLPMSESGECDIALTLVEPAEAQRRAALEKLRGRVDKLADGGADLNPSTAGRFVLILANHCLYYVDDPGKTVEALLARLEPGGVLVAALLDRGNALARLWRAGFAAMDRPFPFVLAEEVAALCHRAGAEVAEERIAYRIAFPDAPDNRRRVLRFLLGAHLAHLDDGAALALFEPWRSGDAVVMETSYPHLMVRGAQSVLT